MTGASIQNRVPRAARSNGTLHENMTIFDKVLENAWDMDAVKFLRNAAHWKSRMILRFDFSKMLKRCMSSAKLLSQACSAGDLLFMFNGLVPMFSADNSYYLLIVFNIQKCVVLEISPCLSYVQEYL